MILPENRKNCGTWGLRYYQLLLCSERSLRAWEGDWRNLKWVGKSKSSRLQQYWDWLEYREESLRLAITLTPVKDHQLTLRWKTHKEWNNNNRSKFSFKAKKKMKIIYFYIMNQVKCRKEFGGERKETKSIEYFLFLTYIYIYICSG